MLLEPKTTLNTGNLENERTVRSYSAFRDPMSSNRGNIYFEIQADDPTRATGFYSEVFGWQFSAVKGLPIEYWRIAANGSEGGLLRRPAQKPAGPCGTNAFVCSFEVESYDLTEQKILRLGGTVHCQSSRCVADAGEAITSIQKVIPSEPSRSTRRQAIREIEAIRRTPRKKKCLVFKSRQRNNRS